MSLLPYNTKMCYLVHRRRGRTFYLSPGKRGDKVTAKRTAAAVLLHTYKSTETEVEVMLEFGNGAAVAANFHQPHLPLTLTREVDEVDGAAPPPACLFNLEPAWGNMYRLRSSQDTSYYVTIRQNVAVLCKRDDPNVRERDQMFRIYDP